jgi:hypothetical protein
MVARMPNYLKPFVLPIAGFLAAWGVDALNIQNDAFAGVLLGASIVLFLLALINNRALYRRFPSLAQWFPFLVAAEGFRFSSPEDIAGPYVRNRTFRMTDLAMFGRLESRTFEDCVIVGPATIAATPGGEVSIVDCGGQFRIKSKASLAILAQESCT